jgi:putative transposase
LLQRAKEKDFTLRGLVGELAERGLKVDYRSVMARFASMLLLSENRTRHRPPRNVENDPRLSRQDLNVFGRRRGGDGA